MQKLENTQNLRTKVFKDIDLGNIHPGILVFGVYAVFQRHESF